MKYIAENVEDMLKLARMLIDGQITTEEYFEATDHRAKRMIYEEVHLERFKLESVWVRLKRRLLGGVK